MNAIFGIIKKVSKKTKKDNKSIIFFSIPLPVKIKIARFYKQILILVLTFQKLKIMKRTNFVLTGMLLVTSLMSCGGSSEKATDENEVIVVDTISEGTAAVEDTVTSDDAETAVEEDVKEVVHNPKYDKILDEMEEKIKELSEKSKKGDAGVLELQRLQLKVTKLMDKVKTEELTEEQSDRYQELIAEMSEATLKSAGNVLDALF